MRRGGGYLKTGQKSFSFPPHSFPSNLEVTGARLPEGIQDCAIGEEANESVSHGDFVEEGLFGLHDVSVWHPEELHQACIQSEALVAFEHQPLVRPALSEVYGGCVVLRGSQGEEVDGRRKLKNARKRVKSYFPPHLH